MRPSMVAYHRLTRRWTGVAVVLLALVPLRGCSVRPRSRGRPLATSAIASSAGAGGSSSNAKAINAQLVGAVSVEEIMRVVTEHGGAFNAVNEATAFSRLAKLASGPEWTRSILVQDDRVQTLLGRIEQRLAKDGFDSRALSNIAHAMAKMRPKDASVDIAEEIWAALRERVIGRMGEMEPQGLANTAWAFATAGMPEPEVFSAIACAALRRVDDFSAQGLANSAWAFATAGASAPELFGAIARSAEQRMGEFKSQELANMAWAFATAGVREPELFGAIARASERCVHRFTPQGLSNIVWAFATADMPAPDMFGTIARATEQRVDDFNPQGLANTVWAFATANINAPDLFCAIARVAERRLDEFTPQNLANTAWAFATAGVYAPELFDAIARLSERRVHEFKPQNLAATAWSFATADVRAPELFGAIARAAERRVHEFKPLNLAIVAWAFATTGVRSPELFGTFARAAEHCLDEFNTQDLANMAWAYATASVRAPELFAAIARTAERRIDEFSPQGLANTAWALSLQEDVAPYAGTLLLLAQRFFEIPSACTEKTSEDLAHERSVATALLTASLHVKSASELADQVEALVCAARSRLAAMERGLDNTVATSRSQVDVSMALRAAGWEHDVEVELEGGLLIVDMACERTRVAVEFDGPMHYIVDLSTGEESYDGNTRWKTRILEALGWRIYRIGWREWAGQLLHGDRRSTGDAVVAELAATIFAGDRERTQRVSHQSDNHPQRRACGGALGASDDADTCSGKVAGKRLHLATASGEELKALKVNGLGAKRVKVLLDERDANGPFLSREDLKMRLKGKGVGPAVIAGLDPLVAYGGS